MLLAQNWAPSLTYGCIFQRSQIQRNCFPPIEQFPIHWVWLRYCLFLRCHRSLHCHVLRTYTLARQNRLPLSLLPFMGRTFLLRNQQLNFQQVFHRRYWLRYERILVRWHARIFPQFDARPQSRIKTIRQIQVRLPSQRSCSDRLRHHVPHFSKPRFNRPSIQRRRIRNHLSRCRPNQHVVFTGRQCRWSVHCQLFHLQKDQCPWCDLCLVGWLNRLQFFMLD